ncbi:bacillithiol biosynthesis deacetylase BshB1 [Evansella vedderi]|uniref:Bacillithiol biosynthesis deacetylase BshB1 n=1 Tax=Evansella vedderi TaxID=38282 RepID=A0ABU0A1T1_9BACI|nr:bacillithiol biosynthesis deacetylase BshB1 [Evansella vedderi]MDQ0257449.1 bacillithiol biosynthesis deacetylase BshB1 [Evansella vedderi]
MTDGRLDILAIGAHPDDVEIGMGGTLAKYGDAGYQTGIINLTKAELSSNGTVEERQLEAEKAAKILKVAKRIQWSYPDRQLLSYKDKCIESLVRAIRQIRPKLVFAPYYKDRHPDHGHCHEIVKEAVFSAGIKRFLPEAVGEAYRPEALYYYQINGMIDPHFVVDISKYMDRKLEALACFKSQFNLKKGGVNTPLNNGYLQRLEGRESILGNEVGVTFGEGFRSDKPLIISLLGETE